MAIGELHAEPASGMAAKAFLAARVARQPFDSSADLIASGFSMRRLRTSSGQMAVYEAGTGHPIVFLHGIGGGASG